MIRYFLALIFLSNVAFAADDMPWDCMVNPKKPQPHYKICVKNCGKSNAPITFDGISNINLEGIEYIPSDFAPCKDKK
jgi:hypothetical protein